MKKLVQAFGRVKNQHYDFHFNAHLQGAVGHFDQAYKDNGGIIGTRGHKKDQKEFMKLLATDLLNNHQDLNQPVHSRLRTKTVFYCASLPVVIRVFQETETKTPASIYEQSCVTKGLKNLLNFITPTRQKTLKMFDI